MTNRILPPGSQFQAIIDGKPTGLAGCSRAAECPRSSTCIRSDMRLTYRFDPRQDVKACAYFIPA